MPHYLYKEERALHTERRDQAKSWSHECAPAQATAYFHVDRREQGGGEARDDLGKVCEDLESPVEEFQCYSAGKRYY